MTGVHLDPDGFTVRIVGSSGEAIDANGEVTFSDLVPGRYSIALSDVAINCVIGPTNIQNVLVTAGADLPPRTLPQVKLVFQPAAGPDLDLGEQAVEATSVQGGWPEARVAGSPASCVAGGGQCGYKKALALNSTPEPKKFGGLFGELGATMEVGLRLAA